ncbi:MAG: beta-N-acetylhexosaminidase [Streptomyces oryziradicis]|nr:beta-N-acetylhexosaminidase [Actinacidiphila oryziradicis]
MTCMRRRRVLSALLLCLGAGVNTTAPAGAAPAPSPLGQVIPAPASVRSTGGAPFVLEDNVRIHVPARSPAAKAVGEYLAGLLRPSTGYGLPLTTAAGRDGIVLSLGGDSGREGYRMDVTGRAVVIRAATAAGLFHGVQTLRQLLPVSVERTYWQPGPWTVARGTVTDRPRYAYRGAMLDVARHFHPVGAVERYIDELALYKINYFHLHLTDDQGWRIAIKSRPRLTRHGGSTQVGGGSGGYFTKADYQRIVRYAASRYMTVVPEVDMPGHINAALASYAALNCNGVARPLYTGTAVGFSSLCVGRKAVNTFIDDVLREIAALTPGPYLHIGGDEARATKRHSYAAFMRRAQAIVGKYGKTVMGWHQLTGATPARGAIAQYWGTRGDEPSVAAAARKGTRLVLSPGNHAYLDMKYNARTSLGRAWAGYTEVRKSYDWNPATFIHGAPASAVLGVEAPMWSETIGSSDAIDYMAFPRLPALAELGWSPASKHGWSDFRRRLAAQGDRWSVMGITYYRSPQVPW